MGIVSGLTKLGAGKILRIGFYVGIGYLIGKGTFADNPEYQQVMPGQVIEYEGRRYGIVPVKGEGQEGPVFEDITKKLTKNEDEVILGKRYRAGCSDDHN